MITFTLPLPPSLNQMIDLAKLRDRRGRPVIYDARKAEYEILCDVESRNAGIFPPREPWPRWELVDAWFFLWGKPRDPIELMAGLKWPVDWLVRRKFVANDSPKELVRLPPMPHQAVDRNRERIEITIKKAD